MADVVKQALDVRVWNPNIFPASLTRDAFGVHSRSLAMGLWRENGRSISLNELLDHHPRPTIGLVST
jgi:hypothetical protein